MTTEARFERQLPTILEDLYLGPVPTYRDEVLARATAHRQRPARTFITRWLPIADLTIRPMYAPRLPWRAIGAVLLIVGLLVAALVVVGSRAKVPPPFGLARNGLVTWALDGDIFVGDPATGTVKRVIATDDLDRNPVFSRDGTRLAFLRQVPAQTGKFDLVVTRPDGTDPRVLSSIPFVTPDEVQWVPDGKSVLVNVLDDHLRLTRYFVDGTPAAAMADGISLEPAAFRPPDGSQILYRRDPDWGALYVMNLDGTGERPIFSPQTAGCVCSASGDARWSPDGRAVAFQVNVNDTGYRLFTIRADGTGFRQLTTKDDGWRESDPAWSPDSTRIAFNRWHYVSEDYWENRPIGIVARTGGPVTSVGVAPSLDGGLIEWAPDATTILALPVYVAEGYKWSPGAAGTIARPTLIDLSDGSSRQLDWSVGSVASWQRLAP